MSSKRNGATYPSKYRVLFLESPDIPYILPLPARPFHQPATTPIFSSCIVELIHLSACSSFAAYVHTDTYESRRPYEFVGLVRILFGFCLSLLNRQDLESLSFGHVSVSCGESSGRTGCASRKTQNNNDRSHSSPMYNNNTIT